VLLVFGAPCQLQSLAGQEHGRTIPLADITLGRECLIYVKQTSDAKSYIPAKEGIWKWQGMTGCLPSRLRAP
jgi:hypothetical protein